MKKFNFIKDILKGICIGAGAILPGISSGVLCVIFGIYDKLVESVLGLFHNFKKNFTFLLPLGIGGMIGVILLGNILKFLLINYPMPTKYTFMGLILGSVPLLLKKIHTHERFKIKYCIYAITSFGLGLLMVLLENYIETANLLAIDFDFSSTASLANLLFTPSSLFLIFAGVCMSIGIVVPRNE